MNRPKKFQEATIDAAWAQLNSKSGARRFLVADEVGLGKTVVAQHLVRRLIEAKKPEPAVVFYVCGSLPLSSQNSTKLLEAIDNPDDRKDARSKVDRLTMVPLRRQPSSRYLHLYALTPTTSLPQMKGPQLGRKEERALLEVLVRGISPDLVEHISRESFRGAVRDPNAFRQLVTAAENALPTVWHDRFRDAVRKVFQVEPGRWLLPALLAEQNARLLFKRLRLALALAVMDYLSPDLVIFDEFQGYSERLTAPNETILMRQLRGDESERKSTVLLLSATPYKMHATRSEDPSGTEHQKSLLELLGYLFGRNLRGIQQLDSCRQAFRDLHTELWSGRPQSERAKQARQTLEVNLAGIMSRTERLVHPLGWKQQVLRSLAAPIEPLDILSFLGLATKTKAYESRSRMADVVAFWSSIPLPLQTMGPEYKLQRSAVGSVPKDTPRLRDATVRKLRPLEALPHPRLRALSKHVSADRLAVPWISPSLPWWQLGGLWTTSSPQKLLVFSHYRATPPAVAGLLSYGVETVFPSLRNQPAEAVQKRRYLRVSDKRGLTLLALFHPSVWLVSNTEPTAVFRKATPGTASQSDVERMIAAQLRLALREKGVFVRRRPARRPVWKLLARLEPECQEFLDVWEALSAEEGGLYRLSQRWQRESSEPLDSISESELHALAHHALCAPGIVLGRAIRRHAPESTYDALFRAAWLGLRTYLDRPWFAAALRHGRQKFIRALQSAVFDGNLESVLDEHLWLERTLNPSIELASLSQTLQLTLTRVSSRARFYDLEHRLRCHASIPFSTGTATPEPDDGLAPRPDEIRRAFNSPFWPHILTTTSVGQEGLDFHHWCRTVVHWDLSPSPTELEQREGRVQRFAGLGVRQAIATTVRARKATVAAGLSPWQQLEMWADQNLADESGLCPWWLCEGAETESFVFDIPGSDQIFRRERLQKKRLLYRLTLGQPNQADLLELLSKNESLTADRIRDALLNLSAYVPQNRCTQDQQSSDQTDGTSNESESSKAMAGV